MRGKSTFSLPASQTQHIVLSGVPLLPAHIATAIADGRISPSRVPVASGGVVLAEPIQDGDMVIPTGDSEEEDLVSASSLVTTTATTAKTGSSTPLPPRHQQGPSHLLSQPLATPLIGPQMTHEDNASRLISSRSRSFCSFCCR